MRLPFGLEIGPLTSETDCRPGWALFTDHCWAWRHKWKKRLRHLLPRKTPKPTRPITKAERPPTFGLHEELLTLARKTPADQLPAAILWLINRHDELLQAKAKEGFDV